MLKVARSWFRGPLVPVAGGFAARLAELGYSQGSAEQQLGLAAHLDRWLAGRGLGIGDLRVEVVGQFLADRQGYAEYRSVKALRPLLDFLGGLGLLPEAVPTAVGPVDVVLGEYATYLLGERGLTPGTVAGYVHRVRPFVVGRLRDDQVVWDGLGAADVSGFVLGECPGRGRGTAKLVVCSLRSLLRWLHATGQIPDPLHGVVPTVAGWRDAGLPKALTAGQLSELLVAPDRSTAVGRRDYAVLLVLSRLGLRAGEVARLSLDDVDWRAGTMRVRGKGDRVEDLPLPADVGAAVVDYLRRGRPPAALDRSVFVRVNAPSRGLTPCGITMIVFDAAMRAGLPKMHAHRLRHTAATGMLRGGATLGDVGQVLRHRSVLTTSIYAKVDLESLRTLAPQWPVPNTGGLS